MALELEAIEKAKDFIENHHDFLIVTHERADGDAFGSMLAIELALKNHGKKARAVNFTPVPKRYNFLTEHSELPLFGTDIQEGDIKDADAIIIVDTSSREQLNCFMPFLDACDMDVMIIDHHANCNLKASVKLLNHMPAAGLIIAELLENLNWLNDPQIASLLFMAVATDTGWFSYNNTTTECYAWAAKLAELGADERGLYAKLFLSQSTARFKLIAKALSSAKFYCDNRLVVLKLSQDDFQQTGANAGDTENLVDQATHLKEMVAVILFVEQDGGDIIKVSLRSRAPFDVNKFANEFGGGGHRLAAGMRVDGPLDQAVETIVTKLKSAINAH